MSNHHVIVKSIKHITHDVLQIEVEKPENFEFVPGQATEISINKAGWRRKKKPFTFTCLPNDDYLQFIIKTYPSHMGVTNELLQLKKNDELILHGVFGTIAYRGEGLFIAGGAGITPFIAIFRDLQSKHKIGNNKLIFANKKAEDIILKSELSTMLGNNFINILSDEKVDGCSHGLITEEFLKKHITDVTAKIYECGPPPMMDAMDKFLSNLHIDEKLIITEVF